MVTDIQKMMLASTLKGQLILWKGERLKHEQKCHSNCNSHYCCVVKVQDEHTADNPFNLLVSLGDGDEVVSPMEVFPFFTFMNESDAQEEIDRVCKIGIAYSSRNYEIIPLTSYFNQVVNAIEGEIDALMRPSVS